MRTRFAVHLGLLAAFAASLATVTLVLVDVWGLHLMDRSFQYLASPAEQR